MKKYLKLYKSGKFYNVFGDDGIIIHYLHRNYGQIKKIAIAIFLICE